MGSTARVGGMGCFVILALLLCIAIPLSCWTDRNMDYWLTYAKDKPTDCPFILSFGVSVFAPVVVLLNIVGEIGRILVE